MPIINSKGVAKSLSFREVSHETRGVIGDVMKEHGHLGPNAVVERLEQLHAEGTLDDRSLRHAREAIEKHTSTE